MGYSDNADAVFIGVRGQPRTRIAEAGDDVQHARRQPGRHGKVAQQCAAIPCVEYTLAPLRRGLHEIVPSLIGWATDHHDEIRANRQRVATAGP